MGLEKYKRPWGKDKKDNYRRDPKKNSFPHRVIDVWNGLQEVVVHSKSMNNFKLT